MQTVDDDNNEIRVNIKKIHESIFFTGSKIQFQISKKNEVENNHEPLSEPSTFNSEPANEDCQSDWFLLWFSLNIFCQDVLFYCCISSYDYLLDKSYEGFNT